MNFRFCIASVLFFVLVFSFCSGVVFADVHYANPGNYKSVLGAAGYSDTIIFNNGVYSVDEPIEVLESWKLFAANPGGAVLRATRSIHTLVDVWSSNVVVSGLVLDGNGLSNYGIHGNYEGHYAINGNFNGNTIINNKRFGVLLTNTNSVFSNNYVANNGEVGIGLLDSPTSTLSGNQVVGSGYTGIYLYNSPGSSLSGNVVNGNGGGGIFLRLSPYSWIQNNVANGNGWTGINLESSGSSAVVTNTANGNNIAGLWLTSTDSTPIIGNTFQYNPYGAAFTNSNGNSFTYNTVTNNAYGVTTPYSNSVSNNLIMDNSVWGLNMDTYGNNLNNPTITDNQIYRNGIGIKLTGNNNILGTFLFLNNSVLANNYGLEFTGDGNLFDGTQLFGNTNGLHLSGDSNVLTNLTVFYNTLNGILIDGNGNKLNDSYFLNNTNGLILNGNLNNINNLFFLNNTNSLILNGNNNLFNGSGALNGTNGIQITGTNNIITNNSVSNQNNTAMYINGNNIVTGNSLTDNNGTGLLIRGDSDVVDFLNMIGNTIIRNGQGINIQGNNNHINNILTLFNILLDNGYSLTITGNSNQMNNTILTLNKNGLQVIGNNNSFSNVTSRFNNQTGIILNGNNNTLNNSLLQNNTNGLIVNGSENHVNSTLIFNNTNGSTINGNNNNLTGNNVHNNTENGLIINGSNNTFIQNNITGNPNAILVENGTNNTLNYNRIASNTHNLHNNGHGTVNAQYNWWGQNNPICITGMNINTVNHAVAVLNVPTGTINPGQVYDITVTLRSSTGEELKMEIPSFLVQFFINNGGDVYPETAPVTNNTAWTQLQVFNPGTYTLTTTIDQQTLTSTLNTPVNSQPVTPHKIPRKPVDLTPNNNLCGAMALGNLLNSLGARADANLISQIGGLTSQGISMYGLSQAASYYGIQLTGLHLDAGQLKPNDIMLLNINGNNHYALILGKLGDNYIIQDPFLGTVVMSQEQFNKYYTGNALTMNPDGRGTPLSIDEMKGLFGGVVDQSAANGLGVFNWEPDSQKIKDWYNNLPPEKREELKKNLNYGTNSAVESWMNNVQPDPLAAAILITLCIGGFILLTGGAGAAVIVPLIPFMGESAAVGTVTVETAAAAAATGTATGIGITATLTGWLMRILPEALRPVARLILSQGPRIIMTGSDWFFKGFSTYSMDVLGIGQSVFEILGPRIPGSIGYGISSLIRNPSYQLTSLQLNTLQMADYYNNTNQDNIISRINNYAKQGYNAAVNWTNTTYNNYIKPLADKFNQEKAEYQKKGLVKYVQSKYTQTKTFVRETAPKVVKYYKSNVRPWMEKNVKPVMHKRLDPVWNHLATQWVVKNVPGAKHVTDGLGWFGNKLGVW